MSKRILILDDNQDILDVLQEALVDEGYEVTALNYCDDIIKSMQQYQPDLVMLDFLLAGINGGELCHEIKTHPLTSGMPVIMLSGFPRVLESLGNYGSDAFIQKPFDLAKLLDTVQYCLADKEDLQPH
jgi:DNA-binding response OmpR family regulator